jgi:hypothetical protein
MAEVVSFLFMIVFMGVAFAVGRAQQAARVRKLADFMRSLEGGRGRVEQGWTSGLASAWVKGQLKGRSVSLDFQRRGSKNRDLVAIYGVAVDNPPAEFDLSKGNALDWLGSLLGVVDRPVHTALGDVVLKKGASEAAHRLLQQGELATKLRALLDAGFGAVRLSKKGQLVVEQRVGYGALDLQQLHAVYAKLFEIAALCERRKVNVKVSGGSGVTARPRFVMTGGGQAALCPYCRDEVELDGKGDDDLKGCDRCDTMHHRACFEEAGGCTVFGCRRRDERAAEPAR